VTVPVAIAVRGLHEERSRAGEVRCGGRTRHAAALTASAMAPPAITSLG
jgi:hypothetical protein